MNYADIYSIAIGGEYRWRWMSQDREWSGKLFMLYFDCLQDALAHGFQVKPGRVHHFTSSY